MQQIHQIHVSIKGRVQGVFFRDYTRKEAESLHLSGWVKNMPNGTVEAVFCGEKHHIESMVSWLHKGSPHADVTSVDINILHCGQSYSDFQIRY